MQTTKTTKYFGNVELNNCYAFSPIFNGQKIRIGISWWSSGNKEAEDILPLFWETIDKYAEINEIAKKAIIDYYDFPLDALDEDNDEHWVGLPDKIWSIQYFFETLFGYMPENELIEVFETKNLQELDIKKVVEKMFYPDLTIYLQSGIQIGLSYGFSLLNNWHEKSLNVYLDKDLNLTGFLGLLD